MSEYQTFNAIYSDSNFRKIQLGSLINKGGAAGKIFEVLDEPEIVAKIFHEKQNSNTNRRKLEAMVMNNPNINPAIFNNVKYVQVAWPIAILEDNMGYCVGYLMPLINTNDAVSLDHLMNEAVRSKLKLSNKYEHRVMAAYNIALMVASLHQCGHHIVDLKPSNISIYKKTMTVALFDCDGFAITWNQDRFPAEFVSEEYIYPEGMSLSPEDMGEEQDKFALAVIIFKLLNNGIHPFAGVLKNKNDTPLSIQERISDYHYAYGLWADNYQGPHPYSLHEFLPQSTLKLFDRSFVKDQTRPTALEWQKELNYLLKNIKQCKKDPSHAYFTSKGCGMCVAKDKLSETLKIVKEKSDAPEKIRGFELQKLSKENLAANKVRINQYEKNIIHISYGILSVYCLLISLLPKFMSQFQKELSHFGISIQLIVYILFFNILYFLIKKYNVKLIRRLGVQVVNAAITYTYCCLIITFIISNNINWENLFKTY